MITQYIVRLEIRNQREIKMKTYTSSRLVWRANFFVLAFSLFIMILDELNGGNSLFAAGDKGGDDIILHKGKIIMRGGKGKGNIILDPGSHSNEVSHHEMPIMPMFNPYAFYPMQSHHEPKTVSRPIYIEDHSAMHHHEHHQPAQHHEVEHHHEEHHQPHHHHEYHHEEPQHHHQEEHHDHQQHHYEPQHHHEMEHHHEQHHYEPQHHEIQHHEPMHHYEHEGHEGHEGHEDHHGDHEHHGHEGYEHHHPMMSMHGSGPRPIIYQQQQMGTQQAFGPATMYGASNLSPEQQAALYQHRQAIMAHLQQQHQQQDAFAQSQKQNEMQQGQGSNEVASQVSASNNNNNSNNESGSSSYDSSTSPSKPVSKMSALLQKSANNPLVQIIKPLFKRNKDQKELEKQKKP